MNLQDVKCRFRGWLLSLTCCLHWIKDEAEKFSFGGRLVAESKITVRNVGRHVIGQIKSLSVARVPHHLGG